MRRWPWLGALATLLAGCSEGPSALAVVEPLELAWLAATEPELTARNPFTTVIAEIHDPDDVGLDVVFWTCARVELACLENTLIQRPVEQAVQLAQSDGQLWYGGFALPVNAEVLLDEPGTFFPVELWAFSCPAGVCDFPARVRARPAVGTPEYEALMADLGDPRRFLADEPLDGVSTAVHRIRLTDRLGLLNANPVVQPLDGLGESFEVAAGEEVALRYATDGTTAFPSATGGRFAFERYSLAGSQVTVTWTAPTGAEAPREHRLWIQVTDGQGGVTVDRRTVRVLP